MSETNSNPSVYYRVPHADGRVTIVDSLERIPVADRNRAERIEVSPRPALAQPGLIPSHIDWPSFGVGFGVALVLVTLLLILGKGSRRLLPFAFGLGLVVLGAGAYFGWLRRTTGQDGALFASPTALVDDAKRAVEKMQQKQSEQNDLLKRIERESK
jgi:hypothetical protein